MFSSVKRFRCEEKIVVAATECFRKNRHAKQRAKWSLQHIPLHVLRATSARVRVRP